MCATTSKKSAVNAKNSSCRTNRKYEEYAGTYNDISQGIFIGLQSAMVQKSNSQMIPNEITTLIVRSLMPVWVTV